MDRYDYTRMKLVDLPVHVQHKYNLQAHARNGYVYFEIQGSIYSLPQAKKTETNTYKRNSGHMDIMR